MAGVIAEMTQKLMDTTMAHEFYGSHFFHAHKVGYSAMQSVVDLLPTDLTVSFSAAGMSIFDTASFTSGGGTAGAALHTFGYADIYRWGGSSSQFSLYIWYQPSEATFELKLATSQAADMAAIILDYINAIMANQ